MSRSYPRPRKPAVFIAIKATILCLLAFAPHPAQAANPETHGCIEDEDGNRLRRVWVTWSEWFTTFEKRTDSSGCVTVTAPRGWDDKVELRVYAHNPVVRVLDGGFFNNEVSQVVKFKNGETVKIPDQSEFFDVAEEFRTAYNRGLREFSPWNTESPNSSSRTSDNTIEASWPDGSPSFVAWTEPKALGSDFPLVHIKQADRGTTTVAHELGHALHFGKLSKTMRGQVQDTYLGWLLSHLDDPFHCTAKKTTPFVAYIEAFGLFAELYPATTRSDGDTGPLRHAHFYDNADDFLDVNRDSDCDGGNDFSSVMGLTGDDAEGAVFGVLFREFASHPAVGLDYAVSRYVDCGSLNLQEYAACVEDREGADSEIVRALIDAAHEFDIGLDIEDSWSDGPQANDEFGDVVASGDFDGDGYMDLAVGAPNDAPGTSSTRSGVVFVFKGSRHGLWPWQRLTQTGLGANEAGDRFGASLAAGDFDGDGRADLAVGAPGEAPGSDPVSGDVFVFRGGATRLSAWVSLTQATLGETNEQDDRFGAAVAAGDFNDDGFDDLAIGAPGEAPGSGAKSGLVFVLRGSSSGLNYWLQLGEGTLDVSNAGDEFGAALAVGDFNRDGRDDLAVGAPGNGIGEGFCTYQPVTIFGQMRLQRVCTAPPQFGSVFVFRGGLTGMTASQLLTQATFNCAGESGDRFGASLAVGDFNDDASPDLAVGAPRSRVFGATPTGSGLAQKTGAKAGYVYVFRGAAAGLSTWDRFSQTRVSGADEEDDRFGEALAAGDMNNDGHADLAIGVPGEAPGSQPKGGFVYLLRGTTGSMVQWTATDQTPFTVVAGGNANQANDRFGESLVIADFDGDDLADLVVGAPNDAYVSSAARSGKAYVLSAEGDDLVAAGLLSQ